MEKIYKILIFSIIVILMLDAAIVFSSSKNFQQKSLEIKAAISKEAPAALSGKWNLLK